MAQVKIHIIRDDTTTLCGSFIGDVDQVETEEEAKPPTKVGPGFKNYCLMCLRIRRMKLMKRFNASKKTST